LYDGYNFKVFRHQPGDSNSLPDYAVNTICETDTGIFWIGTREGMSKFDFRKGIFTHFKHNPDSSNSLVDNNIWMIIKDSENHLWISTRNGLSRFNPANNTFTNFKSGTFNSISNDFVFALAEDSNKNIWIGGRGGVDRYNLRENKFYNYKINSEKPDDISLNGITSLFIKNGTLWAGSYSGLYSLQINNIPDQKIKFIKHLDFQTVNSTVRAIFQSDDRTVWVGTMGEGLIRYNPDSGKWNKYRKSVKAGSISEDYIISLLEDDHGVLWAGTYSSGINKYNRSSERFKTFTIPDPEQNINSSISSVLVDANKSLWIGTTDGKIVEIKNHLSENSLLKFHKTEKHLTSFFATTEIKKIIQDAYGKIWAATFGNGIYRIDPVTGKVILFKREPNNLNSLSNDFVHSLYQSSDGNIWIGTGAGGLNKYDPKTRSFTKYFFDSNNSKSISSDEVSTVCEDSQGFIWAGTTTKGLNRLNPSTKEFERFFHDVNESNSISSNRIICLFIDKKSNLWIGTFGGGLNRWQPETNSFEHFTNKDGLPSNIINSIVEDQFGNLWISTDKGISLFRVDEKTFKNYDVYDGLQGNEFIQSSGFSSATDGKIYFGGVNGLNIFDPQKLYEKSEPANLALTDFKIFNKSVIPGEDSPLITNILYAKEIRLSHDQNFFTVEFASLDFNNPDKTKYAYKLEGFNTEWIPSGNQRFATFTNLDPGEYIFRVKATNSDGTWNEEGKSIKVIVLPPWWQTWWAYILYTIFIVSILYSFRQYEMKRVKLRNELQLKDFESKKLQEVDQLKSHFFANISHEFRTPLTLILGLLQKFEGKTSDKSDLEDYGVMKRNAVRLLQLINQLLELSKIESGKAKLSASENDIVGFVKRIFASFASYAEQKNIKLLFNNKKLNEESAERINLYFDKDKMEKIISNLISNAVKYTPDGNEIEVKTTTQNDFAFINVINTGVTISQADINHLFDRYYKVHSAESGLFEGTGLGLALVKELVELHKGKISVTSEYDVTEFIVSFPLGKAHLNADEIVESAKEEKQVLEFSELEKLEITDQNTLTSKDLELKSEKDIILVVEDHNDLRKYIKDSLSENFNVIESPNGKDGLENALDKIPDLIISDVMMPEMDGYTFCKKIKSNEKTNHIPVILLTAKASTEDKLEGLELGADDYLIKPFNPEELKLRVRNLIKTREELRKKFTSEMVLKPAEVIVPSSQVQFMERIKSIIEANIENEAFGVDQLSDKAGLSRSQLHRKLKAITSQSTTEFIRNFRLQRAAQLILKDAGSMSEIAYKVGFNSQAYFNKSFQEFYGCSPSEYKRNSKYE
jgi:signal transduction histidine kinase/ligand-binding sensor domain-containing protein/DNA-binding response OmpR family regulator